VLHMNHKDAWASGLTLQEGNSDGNSGAEGKGVRFESGGGTVSNCVIRGCNVQAYGGVAKLVGPNALLTHCVIRDNRVHHSSFNNHSLVSVEGGRVENCLFVNNWHQGGYWDNNTWYDDPVGGNSGVVLMQGGVMRNCTIAANAGFNYGVFWFWNDSPLVEHCVVAGNSGIQLLSGNNRLGECTLDDGYAPLAGAFRFGAPEQIFKDFKPFASLVPGNYRLASSSPAINAGPRLEEITFAIPSVDLDGRPRVLGGKLDHGCYEANPPGTLFLVR